MCGGDKYRPALDNEPIGLSDARDHETSTPDDGGDHTRASGDHRLRDYKKQPSAARENALIARLICGDGEKEILSDFSPQIFFGAGR